MNDDPDDLDHLLDVACADEIFEEARWTVVTTIRGMRVTVLRASEQDCRQFLRAVGWNTAPVVQVVALDLDLARRLLGDAIVEQRLDEQKQRGKRIKGLLWCSPRPLALTLLSPEGRERPANGMPPEEEWSLQPDQRISGRAA